MKHLIATIILLTTFNVPISQAGTFSVVKYDRVPGEDPYINIVGAPGVETESYAIVQNDSDEVTTYILSIVDSQTTTEGSFALKNMGSDQNEVGLWGSVEPNEITLDPGTNEVVKVKFKIPENQTLGMYWGGISVMPKIGTSDDSAESNFVTQIRNSLRISVKIVSNAEYVPVKTEIPSSENSAIGTILKYSIPGILILGTSVLLALNNQKGAKKKGKSKKSK